MAYDDVSTWRLYSAEQSVGLGKPLSGADAARKLVRRVKRSKWWRTMVQGHARIRVDLGGGQLDGRWLISYAQPDNDHVPTQWKISIHPDMLNDLVVLHELAHCIAPRWSPSPKRRRRGQIPSHAQLPVHGAGFAAAMAELVREFGDGAVHDELRDAYRHFGVPVMTPPEYQIAVAASMEAERDLAVWDREFEEHFGSRLSTLRRVTDQVVVGIQG